MTTAIFAILRPCTIQLSTTSFQCKLYFNTTHLYKILIKITSYAIRLFRTTETDKGEFTATTVWSAHETYIGELDGWEGTEVCGDVVFGVVSW